MKQQLDDHSLEVNQDRAFLNIVHAALLGFMVGLIVAGFIHAESHPAPVSSYHQNLSLAPVPLPDGVPVGRLSLAPGHPYSDCADLLSCAAQNRKFAADGKENPGTSDFWKETGPGLIPRRNQSSRMEFKDCVGSTSLSTGINFVQLQNFSVDRRFIFNNLEILVDRVIRAKCGEIYSRLDQSYSDCGGFSLSPSQGRVNAIAPGQLIKIDGGASPPLPLGRGLASLRLPGPPLFMQGGAVVACLAHNQEVVGAIPTPATISDCRALYEPDAFQSAGRDRIAAPGQFSINEVA